MPQFQTQSLNFGPKLPGIIPSKTTRRVKFYTIRVHFPQKMSKVNLKNCDSEKINQKLRCWNELNIIYSINYFNNDKIKSI